MEKITFSRDDTRAIKGIAVIMMLFHHLTCFSARYPVGFEGFTSLWKNFIDHGYLAALASSARVCVAIFFFLGGYGMYKRMEAGSFCLLDSIISLFKKYWKVFVIFIPIAFIFFRRSGDDINALCTRYIFHSRRDMLTAALSNFLGLSDSLNSEWWFVQTYVCAMILGVLFTKAIRKSNSFLVDLFAVFVVDILVRSVFPAISDTETFSSLNSSFFYIKFFKIVNTADALFLGITFAKHNTIVRLKKLIAGLPCKWLIGPAGCFAVIWTRCYIVGDYIEMIYAALLVFFISVFFDSLKPLKRIFGFLGTHSTNMWLIHTFYCYYFLEATKIVYATQSVWIDFLILIAMSLVSSVILEFIFRIIKKIYPHIKSFFMISNISPVNPADSKGEV